MFRAGIFSFQAGNTPVADALFPAYPACFSVKGRGVPLLRMPCSPPVFQTTASPGGEMLPPRVPLPARNPQASLLSGPIASRAASTPIPPARLASSRRACWLPGRLPPRFRDLQASPLSGSIASRAASTPIPQPNLLPSVGPVNFLDASHPDAATNKLLLCRARLLPGTLQPRFRNPTCFLPSGSIASRVASHPDIAAA